MDIKELRIGNDVIYKDKRVTVKNTAANGVNLVHVTDPETKIHTLTEWIPARQISPLPIVSGILPFYGFEICQTETCYRLISNRSIYLKRLVNSWHFLYGNMYSKSNFVPFTSIHQLQNFMFAGFNIDLSYHPPRYYWKQKTL